MQEPDDGNTCEGHAMGRGCAEETSTCQGQAKDEPFHTAIRWNVQEWQGRLRGTPSNGKVGYTCKQVPQQIRHKCKQKQHRARGERIPRTTENKPKFEGITKKEIFHTAPQFEMSDVQPLLKVMYKV